MCDSSRSTASVWLKCLAQSRAVLGKKKKKKKEEEEEKEKKKEKTIGFSNIFTYRVRKTVIISDQIKIVSVGKLPQYNGKKTNI